MTFEILGVEDEESEDEEDSDNSEMMSDQMS